MFALAGLCLLPATSWAYQFDDVEEAYQDAYLATPVELIGTVVDAEGLALSGVQVELIAWGDSLVNDGEGASSFSDGSFSIPGLARRSAMLEVSLPGYYTELVPVDLQIDMGDPSVDLGELRLVARQFDRVRLSFGGDTMFGRRMFDRDGDGVMGESGDLLHPETIGEDTQALFRFIEPILHADDHTSLNLETPVTDDPATPHPSKSYVFYALPGSTAVLPGLGVDSVSMGNNHLYDFLEAGVADTVTALADAGLPGFGGGVSYAAAIDSIYRDTVNGVPLSMQGFSNFIGYSYGGDDLKVVALTSPAKGGALPSFNARLDAFVDAEVAAGRFAVPIIHGGSEYAYQQSGGTRSDFARTVEHGADLVIGHHPHVVHGVATYDAGDGPVFVLGSLGNLVFDQEVYETFRSYLAVVDVVDGFGGPRVESMRLVPYRIDGYMPRTVAGAALAKMGRYVGHLSTMEAEAEPESSSFDRAVVFAQGGRLVVVASEAEVQTTDLLDQRSVDLSGGETGLLTLDPYTDTDALAALHTDVSANCELGRDLLVIGDFEEQDVDDAYREGDLWVQSGSRYLQGSEVHDGQGAAVLLRKSTYSSRTSLWMGSKLEVTAGHKMTISGWHKGDNAGEVRVYVRWMSSGGSTVSASTMYTKPEGSYDWSPFTIDVTVPSNADKLKVYFRHYPPASGGDGEFFLDDVAFVDWEQSVSVDAAGVDLPTPNGWDFLRCEAEGVELELELTHRVYAL